jgi:hypothetical protein
MLAVNNVYKHFSPIGVKTQLPGGRCYQKGGVRLENALFNCFPNECKKYIHRNLRPKNTFLITAGSMMLYIYSLIENKDNIIGIIDNNKFHVTKP